MTKWGLIDKFKWTIAGLCGAVVILWAFFYFNTSYLMERQTLRQMEQTSGSILRELERDFMDLEQVSFMLKQSPLVTAFLLEENPLIFHEKAGRALAELTERLSMYSFVENVIAYDNKGNYYRLKGSIGNTEADRIYYDMQEQEFPVHVMLKNHIGFADAINYEEEKIGSVVILMNEDTVLQVFQDYSALEELEVALTIGEQVVISSQENRKGVSKNKLQENAVLLVDREIGFTSFRILVLYRDAWYSQRNLYFFVAVIITAIMFFVLVVWFLGFWKRHFFFPIARIIEEVDLFDGGEDVYLPLTGEEHFDGLVNQINEMIFRIDEKEKQLFKTQFLLQESEITRQRALIIALKKQINAHFIINVLYTIKVLADKEEGSKEKIKRMSMGQVGQMCDGLSFLLRYANAEDEFVSGMEEFFVLEKYISIMEIRYGNKFHAEIEIDDRLEEVSMPRMLLQPVVENAILHGLAGIKEKGRITVSSEFQSNFILFRVEDNGVGMTPEQLELLRDRIKNVANERWENRGTEHIALPNIQKRVESYYGKGCGLTVEAGEAGGTVVTLILPL